jgi:hypothetical protein
MMENEFPMKIFHSYTDARVNIMISHIQYPIRIGTSGPTWATAEEAESTHCCLHLDVKEECERD